MAQKISYFYFYIETGELFRVPYDNVNQSVSDVTQYFNKNGQRNAYGWENSHPLTDTILESFKIKMIPVIYNSSIYNFIHSSYHF